MKVLIVDDDTDCLYQLKTQFEKLGFSVDTAESQKDGEAYIESHRPDLAVLDLMMEQEDSGFILSYKLKKKYPDVPVIIATAVTAETGYTFSLETSQDRQWIKADLYLDKGIRGDQLHREIKKVMKI
ncbi:MAG TPA: response regulator [Bacteroidia bacterium]|nr:response regulator [Sphingobacteriales bacterium]HPD65405.1 response regulator [Bacteroidia bacterium]HRU67392.1 response regulator [Bacteroidia bacterium]